MQNPNHPNTPTAWLPDDATLQLLDAEHEQLNRDIQQSHIFTDLDWRTETEPEPQQMCHLMTVTGLLLIAPYPADHELNQPASHYVAWAPLSSEPTLTVH
jgi:hypothetical protein